MAEPSVKPESDIRPHHGEKKATSGYDIFLNQIVPATVIITFIATFVMFMVMNRSNEGQVEERVAAYEETDSEETRTAAMQAVTDCLNQHDDKCFHSNTDHISHFIDTLQQRNAIDSLLSDEALMKKSQINTELNKPAMRNYSGEHPWGLYYKANALAREGEPQQAIALYRQLWSPPLQAKIAASMKGISEFYGCQDDQDIWSELSAKNDLSVAPDNQAPHEPQTRQMDATQIAAARDQLKQGQFVPLSAGCQLP